MSRYWIPALVILTMASSRASAQQTTQLPAVFQKNVVSSASTAFTKAESGVVRETEHFTFFQDVDDTQNPTPPANQNDFSNSASDRENVGEELNNRNISPKRTIEDQAEELTGIARGKNKSEPTGLPELLVPNLDVTGIGTGALPEDVTAGIEKKLVDLPTGFQRELTLPLTFQTKNWKPANIYHNPVYFEDMMLEQHGQSSYPLMQPWISGARFIGQLALLPYQFSLNGPCEDISNLGSYRPGSGAPCLKQRLPYNQRALRTQLLSTGAAALALPL